MEISAPWSDSYPNTCFEPPNYRHHCWCYIINGSSTTETTIYITQQENLEIIALKPFNKLMMTSVTEKLAPSPQPSTSLQGNQICMSSLDMAHRKFTITSGKLFQDQWTPIQWMQYIKVKNQPKKPCVENLTEIIDQEKQYIYWNKQLH